MNDATTGPGHDRFNRQSEALGRALKDLLTGDPDATPGEQAAHIRQVTTRLTEDWVADEPEAPKPIAGICARCDRYTKNATVRWVTRNSAGDVRVILHADPTECGRRRT